jgi:hypothetical protein
VAERDAPAPGTTIHLRVVRLMSTGPTVSVPAACAGRRTGSVGGLSRHAGGDGME